MLKKIILSIGVISLFGVSFGISQDKLNYLRSLNITIDQNILNKQQISRYEAARYLNYAQCFDCLDPTKKIKEEFNYGWFSNFKKQPNFYLNDISPQDTYYYCVSSLASLDYIHGYPKTNSICGGDFCGSNNLSYGELLQIVVNIVSNKILNKYSIDNVDKFYSNMMSIKGTSDQTNMNLTENSYKIVDKIKNSGLTSYQIQNFDEFYLYEKYCNLFPQECSFKEFGNIKKGNYMLSIVNILYKENLLTYIKAINVHPQKLVSGEELIQWLYKVKKINACRINNDYKKKGYDLIGIEIVCSPLIGNAPLNTECKPTTTGPIKRIVWTYDGQVIGKGGSGDSINYTFLTKGDKKITATAIGKNNDTASANAFFKVLKEENKNGYTIGLQIKPNPSSGPEGTKVTFTPKVKGNPLCIFWDFGDGSKYKEKTNVKPIKTYPIKGDYTVVAKACNDKKSCNNSDIKTCKKVSAVSSAVVKIYKKGTKTNLPTSYLQANPLIQYTNKNVNFSLITKNIDILQISKVIWNFGDDKTKTTSTLSTSHPFSSAGAYPVSATIYLKDGTILPNEITEKIISDDKKYGAVLTANPLRQYIGKIVKFKITPKGFEEKDVKNVTWLYGDGNSKDTTTLTSSHKYYKKEKYPVNAIITLNDGSIVYVSLTEVIIGKKNYIGLQITPSTSSGSRYNVINKIPTNIENKFTFTVDNCNSCPCHFADYKTAFLPGMKIQALLVNPFNPSQIYKVSKMKVVR